MTVVYVIDLRPEGPPTVPVYTHVDRPETLATVLSVMQRAYPAPAFTVVSDCHAEHCGLATGSATPMAGELVR